MTLIIRLFGQPRLLLDSNPLKFTAPPKTLPLLAYLLLHRAQPVERQQAAFALWPDDPESEARANLRRHIHQLQRALPAAPHQSPWLLLDSASVRWNPAADYWLDVAEFERLSGSAETLAEAVTLYSGDLLETVYDDWAFFERERLRELCFTDLGQLVLHHRTRRDFPAATGFAQQLLIRDPFREDALRQLIALRYEAGDRAGAIQEFEVFERRLRREMGVAPMPETQALHEIILRNARLPAAGVPQTASGIADPDKPCATPILPFTGREVEMTHLTARWSRAAHGLGGLALIGGEAGVGKSRLARELALLVERQGGRVLYGGASPVEPRPYQPVVEAMQAALPLLAALEGDPVRLAVVATLLPELRTRRSLPGLPTLEPEKERIRLFDATAACLEKLAEPRPLLIILEDLHWAGEATIALVGFLTRRAASVPMLILGTYRDEETPRAHPLRALRQRLKNESLVEHLPLSRLSLDAVESLLSQVAKEDQRLAARLYTESEGNPLFIEMLWQHWRVSGMLEAGALTDMPLPGGIRAAIIRRLERLPADAHAYAEVAAILGPAIDAEATREVGGWDEAQAHAALRELLDCRLVRDAEGRSRFDYTFAHHLIQATLYAEIPTAKRKRRHLRAAEVLAELYPTQCDEMAGELAVHFDEGGAPDKAIPYYLTAARRASALFADDEALRFLSHTLDLGAGTGLTTNPKQLPTLWELLSLRENLEHRRGDRSTQQADLDWLERVAIQLQDTNRAIECLLRRARFWHVMGQRQLEGEVITELKRRVAAAGHPQWQAEALRAEVALMVTLGQCTDLRVTLEPAMEFYRSVHDVAGQVSCHCLLADASIQLGRFEDAQADLDEAHRLAEVQGDYGLLVQALRAASGALFARQDFSAAHRLATQTLDLCRTIGDREGEADALARLGAVSTRQFAIRKARQYYAEAGALYYTLGKRQGQAGVLVNSGFLLLRLGHYAEGQQALEQAGELFESLKDIRGQAVCALNVCMAAYFQGEYAPARDAAARGLALARQMQSQVMEANALANLGAAERELGAFDDSITHMEAGLNLRRALGQAAELGTDLCDLTIAYLRQGSLEAAQRAAADMLAIYDQHESAMMNPEYIMWAAAQVCRAAGDEPRARDYLHRANLMMRAKAEAIPDAESQATFRQLPHNRQITAAYERGEWA